MQYTHHTVHSPRSTHVCVTSRPSRRLFPAGFLGSPNWFPQPVVGSLQVSLPRLAASNQRPSLPGGVPVPAVYLSQADLATLSVTGGGLHASPHSLVGPFGLLPRRLLVLQLLFRRGPGLAGGPRVGPPRPPRAGGPPREGVRAEVGGAARGGAEGAVRARERPRGPGHQQDKQLRGAQAPALGHRGQVPPDTLAGDQSQAGTRDSAREAGRAHPWGRERRTAAAAGRPAAARRCQGDQPSLARAQAGIPVARPNQHEPLTAPALPGCHCGQ